MPGHRPRRHQRGSAPLPPPVVRKRQPKAAAKSEFPIKGIAIAGGVLVVGALLFWGGSQAVNSDTFQQMQASVSRTLKSPETPGRSLVPLRTVSIDYAAYKGDGSPQEAAERVLPANLFEPGTLKVDEARKTISLETRSSIVDQRMLLGTLSWHNFEFEYREVTPEENQQNFMARANGEPEPFPGGVVRLVEKSYRELWSYDALTLPGSNPQDAVSKLQQEMGWTSASVDPAQQRITIAYRGREPQSHLGIHSRLTQRGFIGAQMLSREP